MNILRSNQFKFAVLAALCVLYSFSAVAMNGYGPMRGGHGPMCDHHGRMGQFDDVSPLDRMSAELDLSEEQQDAIKAITERTRSSVDAYKDQLRGQRGAMRSLMQADSFDEQAARALIEQKQQAKTEIKILHLRQRFEIRDVLTPEQRDAFDPRGKRPRPGCGNR